MFYGGKLVAVMNLVHILPIPITTALLLRFIPIPSFTTINSILVEASEIVIWIFLPGSYCVITILIIIRIIFLTIITSITIILIIIIIT